MTLAIIIGLQGCATVPRSAQDGFELRILDAKTVSSTNELDFLRELCISYANIKDYNRLEKCIKVGKESINAGLETASVVNGGPFGILSDDFKEASVFTYALAPLFMTLEAEKELDFGNYQKALDIATRAAKIHEDKWSGIVPVSQIGTDIAKPDRSAQWWEQYWNPKVRIGTGLIWLLPERTIFHFKARVAAVAATAAYNLSIQPTASPEEKKILDDQMHQWAGILEHELDRVKSTDLKYKAYKLSYLARLYMSTGQSEKALALLSDDQYLGDRVGHLIGGFILGGLMIAMGMGQHINIGYLFENVVGTPYTIPSQFQMAHVRLEAGKHDEARHMLDSLFEDAALPAMGGIYWAALYDRGRVSEAANQLEDAVLHYQRAIDEIEKIRSNINSEASRIGFIGDKQAVYRSLIRLQYRMGQYDDAFVTSERAKSRAMVDMLADRSAAELNIPTVDRAKFAAYLKEQDRRDKILQSDGGVVAFSTLGKKVTLASKDSQQAAQNIRGMLDAVRKEVESNPIPTTGIDAKTLSLVSVPKVSLDQIRQEIPSDATLLSYFGDGDTLYVFAISRQQTRAVQISAENLAKDVNALLADMRNPQSQYLLSAQNLYRRILTPILAGVDTPRLIIAAFGPLHYLPFGVLHDGQSFLADRFLLSWIPSASILQYLSKPTEKPGSVMALGNPTSNLLNAAIEAKRIATGFDNSKLLLGKEATREQVTRNGSAFRYLHFAAHGYFDPKHPLNSGIQLAPSQSDNGFVTAGQLYEMTLNSDMVTLSACETGRVSYANGDDVLGLIRGFMYAGSRTVVASLWSVDDLSTSLLMEHFYQGIKSGMAKDHALQAAQKAVRSFEKANFSHPYYWASFQLSGRT